MPWKGEKDPYKIWLSEIILQQTRVEQGVKYYVDFVQSFPDIKSLATAPETVVFKKWQGLGYYSRCKNLIATAKTISEKYNGIFPKKYEEILDLKGIGKYTASAIASFAFGQPFAVVDGNVKRVLARFFKIAIAVDNPDGERKLSDLATKLLNKKKPGEYNQAIMDFGATVCKPAKPDCLNCPLNKQCGAYLTEMVTRLPLKSKRIKIKNRYFNYLVVTSGKFIYLKKRNGRDIWQHLYEPLLIESEQLLTIQEIQSQQVLQKIFEKDSYEILGTSRVYNQKLTHQKITGQFIRIKTTGRTRKIDECNPVPLGQLNDFAFPKIVATYLKDNDISLNLNF